MTHGIMMTQKLDHSIFTIIAPVTPGQEISLRSKIEYIQSVDQSQNKDVLYFEELHELHYASMFLYEDPEDGWQFVFESNIDGTINDYLNHLMAIAARHPKSGELLLKIYAHCRGFTGDDLKSLKRYMSDRIHHPIASFVAGVGLTRDRIRKDAAIHRVVDGVLGDGRSPMPEPQARNAVLAALAEDPETSDFPSMEGDTGHRPGLFNWIYEGAAILLTGVLCFVPLGIMNVLKERRAEQDMWRPRSASVSEQKRFEDLTPTNHMASIVYLHTDLPRQYAKRAAFRLLRSLVKLLYHEGPLGPIHTIHFAHWAFVHGGRRLLFVSNFDGSWDNYLDDFTLKANRGLTLAWAHGVGFPRSMFMFFGGAARGPQFIDWARHSMVPCPVWYNAYPGVSAKHIVRNRNLRRALAVTNTSEDNVDWLKHV